MSVANDMTARFMPIFFIGNGLHFALKDAYRLLRTPCGEMAMFGAQLSNSDT